MLRAAFPRRFVEEKSSFEYGQVNHALAAAMRTLVKEYLILVTQLEQLQRQGLLSLQKLWFHIQPAMRTVDILASLGARAWREGHPGPGHSSSDSYFCEAKATQLRVLLVCGRKTPGASKNHSFIVGVYPKKKACPLRRGSSLSWPGGPLGTERRPLPWQPPRWTKASVSGGRP